MKKVKTIKTPDEIKITLKDDEKVLERIETPDYILAVSDEKIKNDEYYVSWETNSSTEPKERWVIYVKSTGLNGNTPKKIIAYQPKNNAPELLPIVEYGNMTFKEVNGDGSWYECIDCECETTRSGEFLKSQGVQLYKNKYELDLPLIPEIVVKDDVEGLAETYASKLYYPIGNSKSEKDWVENQKELIKVGFINGYKAATKVYSEDDLRKAFEAGINYGTKPYPLNKEFEEEFIQSLKQPKTPKWFVAETVTMNKGYTDKNDYPYQECEVLKTTTINGKEYLVGTYKFE
jgi:hypothetical protein